MKACTTIFDSLPVDFHALRVSFCTLVNEVGANPKQIQTLSRHAETSLTYRIYTKNIEGSLNNIVNLVYELTKRQKVEERNSGIIDKNIEKMLAKAGELLYT